MSEDSQKRTIEYETIRATARPTGGEIAAGTLVLFCGAMAGLLSLASLILWIFSPVFRSKVDAGTIAATALIFGVPAVFSVTLGIEFFRGRRSNK